MDALHANGLEKASSHRPSLTGVTTAPTMTGVAQREVDAYVESLEEPERTALSELRGQILARLPDAEQCISYGLPAFRFRGKVIAGFGAFRHHLSYFPHSGSVLAQVHGEIENFQGTKSALHFTAAAPLPRALVEELIAVRLSQAFG